MKLLVLGQRKDALRTLLKMGVDFHVMDKRGRSLKTLADRFLPLTEDWQQPEHELIVALTEAMVPLKGEMENQDWSRFYHKGEMKDWALENNLPTTKYCYMQENLSELQPPFIYKPIQNSGSRGVEKKFHLSELSSLEKNYLLAGEAILEEFIVGTECSIETFISKGEIVFENITEYFEPKHANIVPAHFSNELQERLLQFNRKVIEAFHPPDGMTHLEVFFDEHKILFSEICMRPPGGHIMPLLAQAYGINAWEFYFNCVLGRAQKLYAQMRKHAGVYIYHPGPGKLMSIQGTEKVLNLNPITFLIKVEEGEQIAQRMGVGSEVGHVIFEHDQVVELKSRLKSASQLLRFHLKSSS